MFQELKNAEYNDIEELIFKIELTYSEIEYSTLDSKNIDASSFTAYTLPQGK